MGTVTASDVTADNQVLSAPENVDTLSTSIDTGENNNTLSSVNNEENILSAGNNEDSGNNILKSTDENLLKSDENNFNTLSDLARLIKFTPNQLNVNTNFTYVESIDGDGLEIVKNNYVIDFNGCTIDANGKQGTLLTITGNNVTIKNLQFINAIGTTKRISYVYSGKTYYYWNGVDYPILWQGNDGIFENLELSDCKLGINWTGDNGLINNSIIHDIQHTAIKGTNNFNLTNSQLFNITDLDISQFHNVFYGYAIQSVNNVENCNFTNLVRAAVSGQLVSHSNFTKCGFISSTLVQHCYFNQTVGTRNLYTNRVHFVGSYKFCIFENCQPSANEAWLFGGSILDEFVGNTIINCKSTSGYLVRYFPLLGIIDSTFINCTTNNLYYSGSNFIFDGCTFIGNNIPSLCIANGNCKILDSKFIDNIANNGLFRITNQAYTFTVRNSSFESQSEPIDGWAFNLYNDDCTLVIDDNTKFYNTTKKAINKDYSSELYNHLYISEFGTGNGSSDKNPANFTWAFSKIDNNGTIELVNNGSAWNTYDWSITKQIIIKGNNVTFTGNKRILNVATDLVTIENITIKDSASTTAMLTFMPGKDNYHYYLTIRDCHFINNNGSWSGAIHCGNQGKYEQTGQRVTIENCWFENNTATSYFVCREFDQSIDVGHFSAGAILAPSTDEITINGCTFKNNSALYSGAVTIYNSKCFVENCNFTLNNASEISTSNYYGGFATAGALVMQRVGDSYVLNCNFTNNTAPMAGALYINSYSLANVFLCNFTDNNANTTDGGALFIYKGVSLDKCNFTNNSAKNNGSAIYLMSDDSLSIYNSNFTKNNPGNGVIMMPVDINGKIILDNINFIGHNTTVLNLNNFSASVIGGLFENNTGGCIVSNYDDAVLNIFGVTFNNNNGSEYGSAVYSKSLTTISDSDFNNNSASVSGGALYLIHPKGSITGSSFINNSADHGGAIYVGGDDFKVRSAIFIGNNATNSSDPGYYGLGGGAVFVNGSNFLVYDSFFENNSANLGGGLYIAQGMTYSLNGYTLDHFIGDSNVARSTNVNPLIGKYSQEDIDAGVPSDKLGDEFNYHKIYDRFALKLLLEAHVVLDPDHLYPESSGIVNNKTGDRANPIDFISAIKRVAPSGKIIFINSSENHKYSYNNDLIKEEVSFIGNNTTFIEEIFLRVTSDAFNVSFSNFTFKGYTTNNIMILNASGCVLDNCTFVNNTSPVSLGLALVVNGNDTIIKNSRFINNTFNSTVHIGGAVYINASNTIISDSLFEGNKGNFAHLYVCENTESIYITGSNFTDCSLNDDGIGGSGVYVGTSGDLKINGNIFRDNNAINDFGALTVEGPLFLGNISGNTFNGNNLTSGSGAALILDYGSGSNFVYVDKNTFINNAASDGGALFIKGAPKTYSISGNTFTGNNASNNGGAVYINSKNIVLDGSIFYLNDAVKCGGAVYVNATGVTLNHCEFYNNTANESGSYGSAIYIGDKCSLIVRDVTLNNNYVFMKDSAYQRGDICIGAGGKLSNPDGTLKLLTSPYQQYVSNRSAFYLDVVYVNSTGGGIGDTPNTATTLQAALTSTLEKNSTVKVYFVDDESFTYAKEVWSLLSNFTNITLQSFNTTKTLKRYDDEKYLFNPLKKIKNLSLNNYLSS